VLEEKFMGIKAKKRGASINVDRLPPLNVSDKHALLEQEGRNQPATPLDIKQS
jgi:hypothetical protein